MSFLDHAMILFGVALAAFFAGWFVEWLRFGAVLEQHKQITESLRSQYRELETGLAFSKSANKDLWTSIRNRDEQIGKRATEVGKLYTLIQGLRNENANVRELARQTGDQLKAANLRPLPDSRADGGKGVAVAAMVKDAITERERKLAKDLRATGFGKPKKRARK